MDNSGQNELTNENRPSQLPTPITPSSGLGLFVMLILVIISIVGYTLFKKANVVSQLFSRNSSSVVTVTPTPTITENAGLGQFDTSSGFTGTVAPKPTTSPNLTIPDPIITNTELSGLANKTFLGQNDIYSVYIVNSNSKLSPEKGGQLVVLDKKEDKLIKLSGYYAISSPVTVLDNGIGNFLSISHGKDFNKKNVVISLSSKRQVFNTFCSIGNPTFWNSFLLYGNCATFNNRPWVGKYAPSLVALNLKARTFNTFRKSDVTKHFSLKEIVDSTLTYYQTALSTGTDWSKRELIKTTTEHFDLSTLK